MSPLKDGRQVGCLFFVHHALKGKVCEHKIAIKPFELTNYYKTHILHASNLHDLTRFVKYTWISGICPITITFVYTEYQQLENTPN